VLVERVAAAATFAQWQQGALVRFLLGLIMVLNEGCYQLEFVEVEAEDKDELLLSTADLRLQQSLKVSTPIEEYKSAHSGYQNFCSNKASLRIRR
jgi:hypothetical protein